VVTSWSGIAGDGPDGPLLFCTCAGIPRSRRAPRCLPAGVGWPDIAAARTGHQAVTAWIDHVAAFLPGRASRLPAPGPDPPVRHREQAARDGTPKPGRAASPSVRQAWSRLGG